MVRPKPQENLRETLRRAFDALEGRAPEEIARCAGGIASGRTIEIGLLGRTLAVDFDAREVRVGDPPRGGDAPADDMVAAIAVRYLVLCEKLPSDPGPDIGFADSADARGYLGPFRGRVIAPLLGRFGRDPEGFARAAEALGGVRAADPSAEGELESSGGRAYRLQVFPRLAVTFILHAGDDELPPEGQALFPKAAFEAFAVDDVVAAADLASRALRGRLWRD